MGVKSNVQGISIAPLKSALAYADDELGIDVATASYSEICDALLEYFPDVPHELIPTLNSNTYVLYSSIYGTSGYDPWRAFDGSTSDMWQSSYGASGDQYIGYKSPVPLKVDHCTFQGRMGNGTYTWYLQYSDNLSSWTNAGSISVGTDTSYPSRTIQSSESGKHNYWRLMCSPSGNTMSCKIMQLYGWT